MAEELKTLKDLKLPEEMKVENPLGYRALEKLVGELRAEAVKWVRHWRSIDQHCPMCDVWNEKRQEDMMHFLNLTEGDIDGA